MRKLKRPLIIGFGGGTASGKTSIAAMLYDKFKENASIIMIKEDDYYKAQDHLSMEERVKTNYDHPMAFDHELMVEQLNDLILGKSIMKPTYDFTVHNRSKIVEEVQPADIILIEGLFVLENKELRELLDIKVFVDTPADVRFIRRMSRDIEERGRDVKGIVEQYLNTVRIMHNEYIEPSRKYADIVITNETYNTVAIDLLATKIGSILS